MLAAQFEDVRRAWPALDLGPAGFSGYLAERLNAAPSLQLALAALYVAFGCALADAPAVAAFEAHFLQNLSNVPAASTPDSLDEVKQLLRERLLVGSARGKGDPKIVAYTGRGSLASWLHVAAARTALSLRREMAGRQHDVPEEKAFALAAPGQNPELEYLRARHDKEFQGLVTH